MVEPGVCAWLVPDGLVEALTAVMHVTLTLESPVEKLGQMGRIGSKHVALQQDAVKEASKLAALFWYNIKKHQQLPTSTLITEYLNTDA